MALQSNIAFFLAPAFLLGLLSPSGLAQSAGTTAFGLQHSPIGQTNLAWDNVQRQLSISNIGSSGQDGVMIHTERLEGLDLTFQPITLAVGGAVRFETYGTDAVGVNLGAVASVDVRNVGLPNGQYQVLWDMAGVSTYTLRAYSAGQVVYSMSGVSPLDDALPVTVVPMMRSYHVDWNWGTEHKEAVDLVPDPIAANAIIGGQPVHCDLIEFEAEQAGVAVAVPGSVSVTGSGLSSMTLTSEAVRMNGMLNTAVGDTRILPRTGGNVGEMTVDTSLGVWYEDGVEVGLTAPSEAAELHCIAPLLQGDLRFDARGKLNGAPDQLLYNLSFRANGPTVELAADFSALGVQDMTVELLDASGSTLSSYAVQSDTIIYVDGLQVTTSLWLLLHMLDIEKIEFYGAITTVRVGNNQMSGVAGLALYPTNPTGAEYLSNIGIATSGIASIDLLYEGSTPISGGTGGTIYCTGKVNSLGCTPSISATGIPSVSGGTFVISTVNVINNKPGLLIYTNAGRAAVPFSGGLLCLHAPIRRSIPLSSGGNPPPNDCSGVYSLNMSAFATGALGGQPASYLQTPGSVIDVQGWGRDNGFPAPNNATLSNALEFTLEP